MLHNMHPDAKRLVVALPQVRAVGGVFDLGCDRARTLLAMCADTLFIEPKQRRCSLTWRGVVEVPNEHMLGQATVVAGVSKDGAPAQLPSICPPRPPTAPTSSVPDEPALFDITVASSRGWQATQAPFPVAEPGTGVDAPSGWPWAPPSTPLPPPSASQKRTLTLEEPDDEPSEPMPMEPAPSQPASSQPAPSQPAPSQPAPSQPAPSQAVQSEGDPSPIAAQAPFGATTPHVRGPELGDVEPPGSKPKRAPPSVDVKRVLFGRNS